MKFVSTLKIEKPIILTVLEDDKKEDKKIFLTCEYIYETNHLVDDLQNRINHSIELEIPLSCALKYARGISKEDVLHCNIDISKDMMERLKWTYADECTIVDFKILKAGFEKDEAPLKWLCICGAVNDGNYCAHCGKEKSFERWICSCGQVNVGKFCVHCGRKK